jgi:hypothetical protein
LKPLPVCGVFTDALLGFDARACMRRAIKLRQINLTLVSSFFNRVSNPDHSITAQSCAKLG